MTDQEIERIKTAHNLPAAVKMLAMTLEFIVTVMHDRGLFGKPTERARMAEEVLTRIVALGMAAQRAAEEEINRKLAMDRGLQ